MSRVEHGRRVIDQMIDTLGAGSKDIDCVNHVIDQAQKATELQAKVEELEKELKTVKTAYDDRVLDIEILDRENQRYKQALEDIRNKAKDDYFKTDILIIVDKALKGVEG